LGRRPLDRAHRLSGAALFVEVAWPVAHHGDVATPLPRGKVGLLDALDVDEPGLGLLAARCAGRSWQLSLVDGSGNTDESVVPVADIDTAVEVAFAKYQVIAFYADVQEWEGFVKVTWPDRYAERLIVWSGPGGKEPASIAWDMRSKTFDFTKAAELTCDEIERQAFTHDGDSTIGRHVTNARRRPNRWGTSISKESRDSAKKVDAAVCVIGARMARRLVLASPEWAKFERRRNRTHRGGRVLVLS
jgi:hypothetical protein